MLNEEFAMVFPLTFSDISLLLAIQAIVVLLSSELLSPNYGGTSTLINRRRLRNAGIVLSLAFLVTVAIRIISIVTGA